MSQQMISAPKSDGCACLCRAAHEWAVLLTKERKRGVDAHLINADLSHTTRQTPLPTPARFLLSQYALGSAFTLSTRGPARCYFSKSMSYRSDTDATYDRTLLSSVPDPTRAEKQVRAKWALPSLPFPIFGHYYLSPSSSLVPRPSPDLRSLPFFFFPHLIGGLQRRLVR